MYPLAVIVHVYPLPGYRPAAYGVDVTCPYCPRTHHHGIGDGNPDADGYHGHRGAHCHGPRSGPGYVLADLDGIVAGVLADAGPPR